jgi:hypothetical protein
MNFSGTFNPPGGIVRIDARQREPRMATGVDHGRRMEVVQNRLNLNFACYRKKEINGAISHDGPNCFLSLYAANVAGDQSAVGRNLRGAGSLPVQYRDIRTRSGRGLEWEAVYNPSRAFRLTDSIRFPQGVCFEPRPRGEASTDKKAELCKQIARDAGVRIDASDTASVDRSIPINQRPPDATRATNADHNIVAFHKNTVDGKRPSQAQPIMNVFLRTICFSARCARAGGLAPACGIAASRSSVRGPRHHPRSGESAAGDR